MRGTSARAAAVAAGLLAALAVSVAPAHAAVLCGPDPFEDDTAATAAPIAVGETVTRAICQEPASPEAAGGPDRDYFVFTATGDKAYTIEAVDVGAALANDAFDRGGLRLGLWGLNPDGATTAVQQNLSPNGDRIISGILPAGPYVVTAATYDTQIYPETNTMDIKTVQGSEGSYGVRATEGDPAPEVTSLTLSSNRVRGGSSVTATYTLSAPAPPGGVVTTLYSSHLEYAYWTSADAPAGATKVSFTILTKRPATDLDVTIGVSARVGAMKTARLTVRR
jgi:hypothetical protein